MSKRCKSSLEKAAIKWAKGRGYTVVDSFSAGDFAEIIVREGGDTMTFRYYGENRIFER